MTAGLQTRLKADLVKDFYFFRPWPMLTTPVTYLNRVLNLASALVAEALDR